MAKNDAVEDYVASAELEEVDKIRSNRGVHHKHITNKYLILTDGRDAHLLTFARPCRKLDDHDVTPDLRSDMNTIRARFDTYRGCRIESMHAVKPGQEKELLDLGKRAEQ